jgi:predicted ferric reductase
MNSHLWWYVARASGIVAWLLLTAAVLWGTLLAGRLVSVPGAPRWLLALHRHLGGSAVVVTGLHLASLVADATVHFGAKELLVPFGSSWKPGAVAWGVVAFYVLVAVEATSLAMRRLSRRTWRGIHLTAYGLFWMATVHGLTAGTEASSRWYRLTAAAVIVTTMFGVLTRVLARPAKPSRAARPARSALGTPVMAGGAPAELRATEAAR